MSADVIDFLVEDLTQLHVRKEVLFLEADPVACT
jgi:hypothetical protein